VVTSTRYSVLATVISMPVVRSSQLHWHSLELQPPAGTRADRLENTDCIYCCCSSDCGYLRVVIVYKCAESLDAPNLFMDFVDTPSSRSIHTQQHHGLRCSLSSSMCTGLSCHSTHVCISALLNQPRALPMSSRRPSCRSNRPPEAHHRLSTRQQTPTRDRLRSDCS
jgi:hypothetical protein